MPEIADDLIIRMMLVLGIGLVIGLERGWTQREERPGSRTAGIRTFAISSLLGGTVGALALVLTGTSPIGAAMIVAGGLAAYAFAIVVFSREQNRAEGRFSATTAIAGIATFALGVLAMLGDIRIAAAVAVTIAALLALRERLHGLLTTITWQELRSSLVLLAMTFVALPFLPDEPIGPMQALNLRQIWLVAITLAAVSFAGYLAIRYFGAQRGLLVAAVAGGLVSSTAVAWNNARQAADGKGSPAHLAAGVAVASAISYLRVLILAYALNPALLLGLAPALSAAAIVSLAVGLILLLAPAKGDNDRGDLQLPSPFAFWPVVGFAVFLGVISVGGQLIADYLGEAALVSSALLIGLADVDALAASMAGYARNASAIPLAIVAILAAVSSNTLGKMAVAIGLGGGRFALIVTGITAAAFAAAATVHLLGPGGGSAFLVR